MQKGSASSMTIISLKKRVNPVLVTTTNIVHKGSNYELKKKQKNQGGEWWTYGTSKGIWKFDKGTPFMGKLDKTDISSLVEPLFEILFFCCMINKLADGKV